MESGRWPEAWALLSARWRARLTPAKLAADWAAAGPVGRDAAARARAVLASGAAPTARGEVATLPIAAGRAALLVLEDGAWKVDALE